MTMDAMVGHSAVTRTTVDRLATGVRRVDNDSVAVETPLALVYNCVDHAVMMGSPCHLEDFALGFTVGEGIVNGIDEVLDVCVHPRRFGFRLAVEIAPARAAALVNRGRNMEGRTGCGLCGITCIDQVLRELPVLNLNAQVSFQALTRALDALPSSQSLNLQTGAVHAAAFADCNGRLLLVREDVGRHNALDKVIGAATRAGLDPGAGFVVVTSRCSMEIVQKTVRFGCPVLVAISAPTSLALELASLSCLTIAAFARGARLNLYTHPGRIV